MEKQPIIRYFKTLSSMPGMPELPSIIVRNYQATADQFAWISIHQHAFSVPRAWGKGQFVREFLQKSWWNPRRMWFACDALSSEAVGSVTLGEEQSGDLSLQTVQWLAVLPSYQRRGVANLLISHAELAAWNWGYRRLELETLATWSAARCFYERRGWQPVEGGRTRQADLR